MPILSEEAIEQLAIALFRNELHYDDILYGPNLQRQPDEVLLEEQLQAALEKLNPELLPDLREEAYRQVTRTGTMPLLASNEAFHTQLTEGIDVKTTDNTGQVRTLKAWLVDFNQVSRNRFTIVNQFTIVENGNHKRLDMVLFVNGLPLVVIEIKNAADEKATAKKAYDQLQTYRRTVPTIFCYNCLLVATDGWFSKAGTLSSDYNRFAAWKLPDAPPKEQALAEPDAKYHSSLFPEATDAPEMEPMLKGMLNKQTLLDLVRHFIVFERTRDKTVKKVAAYHQYYAVNKALQSTIRAAAPDGDKRAGVVWHTQGSGKSLSMVFYTGKLVLTPQLQNPTIVVLTDRNDLDQQLFETFSNCQDLVRQAPVQADSRQRLKTLLSVPAGGVVFTTIQKFLPEEKGGDFPLLSDRRNIVVIADEAHRSQYDFIDGYARYMRDALPNATFIGFTGTPIEKEDRNTQAIFGNYVDVYDVQQAVEDGATVRIFYENRLARIELDPQEQQLIDQKIEEVTEEDERSDRQQRFAHWTQQEAIIGSDKRLRQVAKDLVAHFEKRTEVFDGKGMIVCMSRRICVALFDEICNIRPEWQDPADQKGVIKVIMTGSSSDPEEWQDHIRTKSRRKAIGDRLKDPADPLKLVIVRDMWLTGFDAPCLHTLYVDKPMTGHNLMQAIARVNRVFKDKEGGLIVDYLGIAQDLKKALSTYTASGGKGKIEFDQREAVDKMMELYEIIVQLFDAFDFRRVFALATKEKLQFILDATDYILQLEAGRERFVTHVTNLSKAFALSVPQPETVTIRDDVAFFQSVKARIVKLQANRNKKTDEEVETAIRQIVSAALVSSEVVDVFEAAGIDKPEISVLSDEFLAEIKGMQRKNLALELLKRLLKDEIRQRSHTNLVQGKKFSEMLEAAIRRYQNNAITAAQVIDEVIRISKEFREAGKRGEQLGLDFRELAFYDALEINDSAAKILGDPILRTIARDLVASIKKNITIDWERKDSVQAAMRVTIKRILKRYGYPPDQPGTQDYTASVNRVLTQAKMLAQALADK